MTMRARRPGPRPPLAGLIAFVVLVAVGYVVITAAGGLPWDRPYSLTVNVPDAQRLATNSEVRIRGVRVGRIGGVSVVRERGGRPQARLSLEINRSVAPLTTDAKVAVRAAATLGATYLDIAPAGSGQAIDSGGDLPYHAIGGRSGSVTDLLDVFDKSTRLGIQRGSREVSAAFAGRGIDINPTIVDLAALLPDFQEVARTLADPETQGARFVRGLSRTFTAIEPVSPNLRGLLVSGATTLDAIARERGALGSAIERSPAAVEHATTAITGLTPVLDDAGALARTLRPSVRRLSGTARQLNRALRVTPRGARALRTLLRALRITSDVLGATARDPSVDATLQKLAEAVAEATPLVSELLPAQVACNIIPMWAEGLSASGYLTPGGIGVAAISFTTAGAVGEPVQNAKPSPDAGINFLPNLNESECESGNEPLHPGRAVIGNPSGLQHNATRMTEPPGDARERAQRAGLLDVPRGAR